MTSTWKQLQQAFVDDHQALTRGYRDLENAIESRDFATATKLAGELDKRAGPHIEFEERFLYPEVESVRGRPYSSRLYREHEAILGVLVELQAIIPGQPPSNEDVARWKEGLRQGMDHAATCGTLLSHLESQAPKQLEQLLGSLKELRSLGHRWSELKS